MAESILYLDFSANTEINEKYNLDKIYKVGLKDQFERLQMKQSYKEYVTEDLPDTNVRIGISYPNFERKKFIINEKNRWFNIAVRVEFTDSHDLVMMCDLEEYTPKNKPTMRFLKVKGFTLLDIGAETCGEIETVADVATRLDINEGWYFSRGEATKYCSEIQLRNSLMNSDFLTKLNEKYVAIPSSAVLKRLDLWTKYLDARTEMIRTDLGDGYSIDISPEIFIAYYKNEHTNTEGITPIEYLSTKSNNEVWSRKEIEGSEQSLLIHIAHDFLKKDIEGNPSLKKDFEKLTSNRSLLISEEYHQKKGNDDKAPEYPNNIQLMESRISSKAGIEEIINSKKIDEIKRKGEINKNTAIQEIDKKMNKEVSSLLDDYENDELPELKKDYMDKRLEEIRPEVESERKKLIDSKMASLTEKLNLKIDKKDELSIELKSANEKCNELKESKDKKSVLIKRYTTELVSSKNEKQEIEISKKLSDEKKSLKAIDEELKHITEDVLKKTKDLETIGKDIDSLEHQISNLDSEFDLKSMLDEKVYPLVRKYEQQLVKEKEEEIRYDLRDKYDSLRKAKLTDIQKETESLVNDVLKNETVSRLHLFYRLDVSNDDLEEAAKSVSGRIKGKQMFIYRDPSGDRAIIDRQRKALNNLKNGYVMNPFLATALFNCVQQKNHAMADIRHFYSDRLNQKQKEAVMKAVGSNGMFLIRGPPGTGKTEVIAEITAQLVERGNKVLIASENHKAVDNAFLRLPKLPTLRRVRLFGDFATKRENLNEYCVANLTRNFYKDIAKCLNEEIDKTENAKTYAEKFDSMISDLRERLEELNDLENSASEISKEIENKEKEINKINSKISRDQKENIDFENEIAKYKEIIRNIEEINTEFFDEYTSDIKIEYNDSFLTQKQIRSLYALKKTDIKKEFITINKHREFFDIFWEIGEDGESKTIEIMDYQDKHGINAYQFKMMTVFDNKIPDSDTVLDLKDKVDEKIEEIISRFNDNINENAEICNDTSHNEQTVKELEKELQELRSSPEFERYEKVKSELNSDILKALSDNNIVGKYKSLSEGIDFIEQEKDRIEKNAKKGLSEKIQKAYKKMSDYLLDEDVIVRDEEQLNKIILGYCNVIGLTCTTKDFIDTKAGQVDLKTANIDVVIVDEVSKVSFLEVLYPILYGKTVILVGDDKQLPPMYHNEIRKQDFARYNSELVNPDLEKQFKEEYEYSFFKELYEKMPDCNKTMLTVQYRMHPDIMEADNIFYGNQLTYGGQVGEKDHYLEIKGNAQRKLVSKNTHLMFIDVDGREDQGYSGGTSYINEAEIEVITNLLKKMEYGCKYDRNGNDISRCNLKKNDTRLSLGVICGYSDQAKLIRKKVKDLKFQSFNHSQDEHFMVDTVDNFQGDERDIIILSLVRSTPERSFMNIFNRINVAISRARRLLIIVGNGKAFSNLQIDIDGKHDYVYRKIVDSTKTHHGYFTSRDVLGE